MNKKDIIELLKQRKNYYYKMFNYYYDKEIITKNRKLKKEYHNIALDNYTIYIVLDGLYNQATSKTK